MVYLYRLSLKQLYQCVPSIIILHQILPLDFWIKPRWFNSLIRPYVYKSRETTYLVIYFLTSLLTQPNSECRDGLIARILSLIMRLANIYWRVFSLIQNLLSTYYNSCIMVCQPLQIFKSNSPWIYMNRKKKKKIYPSINNW